MKSLKPRKVPQQSRSQTTQKQILEAAARLWNKGPGVSVTTNHIARTTGISIGTLYKYYPNKDSILSDLAKQMMEDDLRLISQFPTANDPLTRKSLERIVDAVIERHKVQIHLRSFVYQNLGRLKLLEDATNTRKKIVGQLANGRPVNPMKMWIAMNAVNGILHASTQMPESMQNWNYTKSLASLVIENLFEER